MLTYNEANQCRLNLKMKLFCYSWYQGSEIKPAKEGYSVVVSVKYINKKIKSLIPKKIKDVNVELEVA